MNTPVSLLLLSAKLKARAAAGTTLITNVTDSEGLFSFTVPITTSVPSNSSLAIVETSNPDVILKSFTSPTNGTSSGGGFVDAPVETNPKVGRSRICVYFDPD